MSNLSPGAPAGPVLLLYTEFSGARFRSWRKDVGARTR
jgi:hypothetical protein